MMRKIIFAFIFSLGVASGLYAQMKILPRDKVESVANPRLSPDSSALDFETRHIADMTVNEDDPPSTYVFPFTNIGEKTVKISRLVSTCSCAAASSDKMEIRPGESAKITVRYDPKGHPGRFERRVFVYTSGGNDPAAVLRLSVNVGSGADPAGLWPVQMGTIRLRRSSVSFAEGEKAVEKLRFINLSGRPIKLQCEEAFLPDCLTFRTDPEVVGDGQEGEIRIAYDPSKPGAREQMKVILKGLGVAPSQATISVLCHQGEILPSCRLED